MEGPGKTSKLMDILTSLFAVLLLALSGFGPRKARNRVPAPPPANHLLAELTTLSQKIASHALRLQVNDIVTQARMLLNSLQAQPDTDARWQDHVRACLVSAVAGVRRFTDRSPHLTEPTDPTVVELSGFLTALSLVLTGVFENLTDKGAIGGAPHVESNNRLHDIDRAYFGGGGR